MQTVISETDGRLLTELSMLNTGECPSVAVGSTLSQILEANAPEKYYLSAKACEGILRRAERRGKQLPKMLKEALEQMIERERKLQEEKEWEADLRLLKEMAQEEAEDYSWML